MNVADVIRLSYKVSGFEVPVYTKLPKDPVPLRLGGLNEKHQDQVLGTAKLTRRSEDPAVIDAVLVIDLRDPISEAQAYFEYHHSRIAGGLLPIVRFWVQPWWHAGPQGLPELDRVELLDKGRPELKALW